MRPEWTLQAVLTPTAITALVLALATISPARTAAGTKVMVVLNPAAADQPTLEDLAKLRERRANYGLLVAGLILLAFCGVILILFPVLFQFGDQSALAITFIATYLLMVVGMSLVFYFLARRWSVCWPASTTRLPHGPVSSPVATPCAAKGAMR